MILVALNFLHCCLVTQREKYMVLYRESLVPRVTTPPPATLLFVAT